MDEQLPFYVIQEKVRRMRPSPFNKASGSSKVADGDKAPAPAPMPALSEESSEVRFCPALRDLSFPRGNARP